MRYYFAPMEGLTDSIYRRLHHKYFPGLDRYYTPFFSPTVHRQLTPREKRELPPADTLDCRVIPQILTKVSGDFIWMSGQCRDLGYDEVNLNLGCPSGTVTAKGKGAGMLSDINALDAFLYDIFSGSPLPVSVKTRLGVQDPDEFPALIEVFNRYPIKELTIHPRVRTQFYNGNVDMDAFDYAVNHSRAPLCYNGNLLSGEDISRFRSAYPQVNAVMLGRALIADPGMLSPGGTTAPVLEAFHDELLDSYTEAFGGARNAMFRMKENWRHMLCKFEDSEKLGKRLRKTTDLGEYRAITREIFRSLPMGQTIQADW